MLGTLCGLLSAIGYSAANVCLRAVASCDPAWVSCVKAFPTVALIAPWVMVRAHRGERILPSAGVLAALALSGLLGQLGGNVLFQWSLGIVGIALTVPLTLGTMILSSALMGRVFLHEPVTQRAAISIVVLIGAICVLSLGAADAYRSVTQLGVNPWMLAAGVTAACLSGIAYAVLGVVIRYGVTGRASLSTTLITVAIVGVIGLGGLSYARIGLTGMLDTSPENLSVMLLAGVFNAGAFLALTKALQSTTVVHVNSLNASQAAMAATAGVLFFHEAFSQALLAGVLLTVVGLVLMRRRTVTAIKPTATNAASNSRESDPQDHPTDRPSTPKTPPAPQRS